MTAYRWFRAGLLLVLARRAGCLILAGEPGEAAPGPGVRAVFARVSSAGQEADLAGQVARVIGWADGQQMPVGRVVAGAGSALNGHRRKFLALLGDPIVTRIEVWQRERFCRFGSECAAAAAGDRQAA